MKKFILGLVIGLLFTAGTTYAIGEWGDWWRVGSPIAPGDKTSVKRIYDKENKLVCWIFSSIGGTGGIDCEPSLELNNPLCK